MERCAGLGRSGRGAGHSLAVASLILGIAGVVGLPVGPLALGVGIAGRRRLARRGEASGLAIAGIVLGVCGTLLLMAEISLILMVSLAAAHLDLSCLETGARPCWH